MSGMANRINWQKRMEETLAGLDGRPALLLHACCAPCATYVLECLKPHFDVTLYYYNPNIHPQSEYEKRLGELKKLARITATPLIEAPYRPEEFFSAAEGLGEQPEGGARCAACFRQRLAKTAKAAKKLGFGWFATTLTVSPHKNAELINAEGFSAQKESSVSYLASDFKKKGGYERSTLLCREYCLYRQDYCGCVYSLPPDRREKTNIL